MSSVTCLAEPISAADCRLFEKFEKQLSLFVNLIQKYESYEDALNFSAFS